MSFLKFKTIEPAQAEPIAPAEVFTVPEACWKCENHYECHICQYGLKEPLVKERRYGKINEF